MATLRAWRGAAAASSSLPQLQYKALTGQHVYVPPGGNSDYGTVLPAGLQVIFDWGAHWEGEVAYRPKFDDSRMRLRGVELPPFSNEDGYMGAVKLHVMVQRHGLCSLLTTSESATRAIDLLYDTFTFAIEAQQGQLPVYRIEEPRGFNTKFRPDPVYAPRYSQVGWVHRDPNAFGPRLIPPPKPILMSEVTTAPALESDKVFNTVAPHAEVIPPEPGGKKKAPKRTDKKTQQFDPELNDVVPF